MGTTRLEEENKRLKEVNRQLTADYTRSLERLKSDSRQIDELKTEVRELKAELNARLTCDFVKTAQTHAVQDFAEKLKKVIHERDYVQGYAEIGLIEEIDELLEDCYGND